MPTPTPLASSPRTVYDIVKSHIHLPINRDYNALKRVLRDWLAYTTRTPLQEKPTFSAELVITVTRLPPASLSAVAQGPGGISGATLGQARSTRRAGRRWALWGTRAGYDDTGGSALAEEATDAASFSAPTIPPYVYRKVVPLHVWTAVLPWEMQRGLSFSDMRLPANALSSRGDASGVTALSAKAAAEEASHHGSGAMAPAAGAAADPQAPSDMPVRSPQQRQLGAVEDAEEEDPYGVVTPSIASFKGNSASVAAAFARTPLRAATTATATAAVSSLSITPPAPAMLFLTDMRSTKAYGIGFWSGAICQAIDVLFVGPTLPSSVGGASASFRQLRQQDGLALVMDNKISSDVLHRFFPLHEIRSPLSSAASASSAPSVSTPLGTWTRCHRRSTHPDSASTIGRRHTAGCPSPWHRTRRTTLQRKRHDMCLRCRGTRCELPWWRHWRKVAALIKSSCAPALHEEASRKRCDGHL
ncbi:hypothetical_protein (plasmid) [Leishmania braziliensis MHOM/BR/75/M2904]|uniref:Hypothetical_protein n=1 Tax=Leishmania braziliensis MHOM/BR/75/M2904 TaxID=420245 RepID=A0A3P3Z2Y6_LEIBR|nr:hypothetical_protein [Leishmania braziliensis MHOM/BR/75/M2904]